MTDPVIIGDCTLYQGDCLEVMASWPECFTVDAVVTDPPYEALTQAAIGGPLNRADGRGDQERLSFAPIDGIRESVVATCAAVCRGWFIAFCTMEGVGRWADAINVSPMRS